MKVRNIAFFGVMASILGVGYANADTPATVIASKAYADTKEATANKKTLGSATWATITDKDSDVKFPTMKVLDSAITNAVNTAVSGVDISGKVDIDQGPGNKDKVFVTDGSGKEAVYSLGDNLTIDHTNKEVKVSGLATVATSGAYSDLSGTPTLATVATSGNYTDLNNKPTLGTAAPLNVNATGTMGTSSSIIPTENTVAAAISAGVDQTYSGTSAKAQSGVAIEGNKEKTTAVTGATAAKIATVGSVQNDVLYMKGTGLTNHTASVDSAAITTNQEAANTAWAKVQTDKLADDKVPTVAAVEARVKSGLAGKQDTITSTNKLSNTLVSGLGTAATKDTTNSYSATGTNPITGTGVATALGTLDSNVTATNQVFTKIAIVDGKLDDATSVKSGVTSAMITDGTIVNADVNATANITYGKMQNALYDINSASAATCSETNPCVLSYIGGTGANAKFKWTNMDIDGLTVNTTVAAN